ncbi:MAG: malate synthase A, partial [Nitrososphaerota archaeon]
MRKTIALTTVEGKRYTLSDKIATLMVRPRGVHLQERHIHLGNEPIPAALFDFGLYLFHNAHELRRSGTGPYIYIPKIENYIEAKWWCNVFADAEKMLNIPHGTVRCSILIETIT